MIHNWALMIGGFRQRTGHRTGLQELWLSAQDLYAAPGVVVQLLPWYVEPRNVADLIQRTSAGPWDTKITLACYSWGAATAVNLARALKARGYIVEQITSADGVYRHRYTLGQWRALVPWSKLTAPANVKRVVWFRQQENIPCGHDWAAVDGDTEINPPYVLTREHAYMDEAAEFHEAALYAIKESLA